MKKIILFLGTLLFVVGCDNLMNTPTKKVENFLDSYKNHDEGVLTQLDDMISTE